MKRNALLVGGFVLLGLAIAVGTLLWLSGNGLFQKQQHAVVFFQGSVTGLYIGAPVTFRGVAVGQVEAIEIQVDNRTFEARIPVRVRLRPDSVRMSDRRQVVPLDLADAVQRGLRARLVAQSFVTGQKSIELDFAPNTPAVLVAQGREPEIPALGDRFGALIEQVAELPLRQTVDDLRHTLVSLQKTLDGTQRTLGVATEQIAGVGNEARATLLLAGKTLTVATDALRQVQGNANATLASVKELSTTTRETVAGLQPELQRTVAGARQAAESAQLAMGRVAELTAPGASLRDDLDSAVRDLSQAARSLRAWSELLEEKPNAVIFGGEQK